MHLYVSSFKGLYRFLIILSCLLLFSFQKVYADIQVIVHPSAETESITGKQLRHIYSIQYKRWANDKKIRVITLHPQNELFKKMSINHMKIQPYVLSRQWNRLKYSGTSMVPIVVRDEDEMISVVKRLPGAIGYISTDKNILGLPLLKVEIK
ncbi:MAG: hypothetical protein U9N57_10585 [Pseudomonadota bacterium]|nr:hypothetical protein [Pseudomonadota bacterium]